jgi:IBR domain, a half RING-finger domain
MSCTVCHKQIQKIDDGYEQEEDKYSDAEQSAMCHFECMELSEPLKQFEKVIEDGEKMYCPGCGAGGRKDNNCTHMTCNGCQTVWCYMCGLDAAKCNKVKADGGIFSHNIDWDINPKRCPMYFYEIHDLDTKWPSSDEECLALFHKRRSLNLLRQYIAKVGVQFYKKLTTKFTSVSACGYSLDEILKSNIPLFDRYMY